MENKVLSIKTKNENFVLLKQNQKYLCIEFSKIQNKDFDETKHPRDRKGQFVSSGEQQEDQDVLKKTNINIVEISGNEVEKAGGFIEYYKQNLKGRKVTNPVLGEISFYERHAKETLNKNKKTPENLKFIAGIYKMLETSEDVEPEDLYKPRNDDIKKFYKVSGYIAIRGEKPRKVSVKIAEDINGKKYYTLDARTDEQKKSLSTDTSLEAGLSKGIKANNLASVYNVTYNYKNVNIFFE